MTASKVVGLGIGYVPARAYAMRDVFLPARRLAAGGRIPACGGW